MSFHSCSILPILLLSLWIVPICQGFTRSTIVSPTRYHRCNSNTRIIGSQKSTTTTTTTVLYESTNNDDDDFMKSLRNRINQVTDRDTKIPIVVVDTMLPRQVLKIEVSQSDSGGIFHKLVKEIVQNENPVFGMVGLATLTTGQTLPLQNGVEVEVVDEPIVVDGKQQKKKKSITETTDNDNDNENDNDNVGDAVIRIKLRAGRRFRILPGEMSTSEKGWTEARVVFLDSKQEEAEEEQNSGPSLSLARAMRRAEELIAPNMNMNGSSLIERWIELARENEHFPGQIDQLLKDLGDIPPVEEPSELAFWVGALINPLPGMGVAMEIRPLLLMAKTSEERIGIALNGILASIRHMDGTKKLF